MGESVSKPKNPLTRFAGLNEARNDVIIEFTGNRTVTVDCCRGVIEYEPSVVRLGLPKGSVRFMGRELEICELNHEQAIIRGFILSMEFII